MSTAGGAMELRDIYADAKLRFISQDGLMALEPNHFRKGYGLGYPETVDVDNGMMFLVQFLWLINEIGGDIPTSDFTVPARLLEYKSYYLRNPGRIDEPSPHDERTALASGAVLMSHFNIAKRVYFSTELSNNGGSFKRRIRTWADRGFYALCALEVPSAFHHYWHTMGWKMAKKDDPRYKASETLLNWVKYQAVKKLAEEGTLVSDINYLLALNEVYELSNQWFKQIGIDGIQIALRGIKGDDRIRGYYLHEKHPNRMLAELL